MGVLLIKTKNRRKKTMDISNFISVTEGRLDYWRTLHRIAKALVGVAERDKEAPRQESIEAAS